MFRVAKPFVKVKGLTLLETMFAIAIGALVLIGAVIFYMSTKQNANTNKAVSDMNSIVAGTESYLAGGNNITGLATGSNMVGTLQDGGYLPKPINDPWGQEYTAVVAKSATTSTITITIPGIGAPDTTGILGKSKSGDTNCNAILQAVTGSATYGKANCSFTYPL